MDISIIICTYNRCECLLRLFDSLARMQVPAELQWEILIVDNNSTDRTHAVVEERIRAGETRVRYLFEKRQGKSFALNTGVREARGEIVAFTDDDVFIDSNWLSSLKNAFDDQSDRLGVGGRILPVFSSGKPRWLTKMTGPYQLMNALVSYDLGDQSSECDLRNPPYGANMAFRRSAFAQYGYFRTDLGPSGGSGNLRVGGGSEDTEFCRRLLSAGERLVYEPKVLVYHPVEKERASKKYYLHWYFNYGRSFARIHESHHGSPRYFGIPGYLLYDLCAAILSWMVTYNSQRRFYRKLNLYQLCGEILQRRTDAKSEPRSDAASANCR